MSQQLNLFAGFWTVQPDGAWVWKDSATIDQPTPSAQPETSSCSHPSWQRYQGFVRDYMYCTHCDKKRELEESEK